MDFYFQFQPSDWNKCPIFMAKTTLETPRTLTLEGKTNFILIEHTIRGCNYKHWSNYKLLTLKTTKTTIENEVAVLYSTLTLAKYCIRTTIAVGLKKLVKIMSEDSSNDFNIADCISSAKEAKQGIYSNEPHVTSQQLASEVKAADAEFSQVIDKELKRMKVFTEQENHRVLQLRRQNGAETECPICLEVIPAISMEVRTLVHMPCCGVSCHQQCHTKWKEMDSTTSIGCFHCRKFTPKSSDGTTISWEELTLTGSTASKANALYEIAIAYENGTGGKKRNLEEALKYKEQAAELGNALAQAQIAANYHNGQYKELSVSKSPEKAMDMVHRAVDQGHCCAQSLLGAILSHKQYDSEMDASTAEAYRLYTLSASQGCVHGMVALERFYSKQYEIQKENNESFRKYRLLRLYWAGRVCDKKKAELTSSISPEQILYYRIMFVAFLYGATEELWHKRPCFALDPLTGYSHIPLVTSMFSTLYSVKSVLQDKLSEMDLPSEIWKHICANCGKEKGDKEECTLKQ